MRRKWYWGLAVFIVILFTAGVFLLTQRNSDTEPQIIGKPSQFAVKPSTVRTGKSMPLSSGKPKQYKKIKELTAAAEAGDISWSEVRRQVNRIAQQSNQLEEFLNDAD